MKSENVSQLPDDFEKKPGEIVEASKPRGKNHSKKLTFLLVDKPVENWTTPYSLAWHEITCEKDESIIYLGIQKIKTEKNTPWN